MVPQRLDQVPLFYVIATNIMLIQYCRVVFGGYGFTYSNFRGPVSGEVKQVVIPTLEGDAEVNSETSTPSVIDFVAKPDYTFSYGVDDPTTGNSQAHYEHREGNIVEGQYSLVEPDGSLRRVTYTADPIHGFRANVEFVPPLDTTEGTNDYNSNIPQTENHEETLNEHYEDGSQNSFLQNYETNPTDYGNSFENNANFYNSNEEYPIPTGPEINEIANAVNSFQSSEEYNKFPDSNDHAGPVLKYFENLNKFAKYEDDAHHFPIRYTEDDDSLAEILPPLPPLPKINAKEYAEKNEEYEEEADEEEE